MSEYVLEEFFVRARELFARTEEWLSSPAADGVGHEVVEEKLAGWGLELLRLLFQAWLELRAAREQRRARVTGPDGIVRTRAEKGRTRQLSSVFGPVTVSRIAYRAPGAPDVHLADAQLNLPAGRHSHGLSKMAASAAVRVSLEQACVQVSGQTGSALGRRQCQQLARAARGRLRGLYASAEHRPPPGAGTGQVLVLSCDGKGIRVRPGELRPAAARKARKSAPKQDGRLSRGEVRTRKRMAEVAGACQI